MRYIKLLIPRTRDEWMIALVTVPILTIYVGVLAPLLWAFHALLRLDQTTPTDPGECSARRLERHLAIFGIFLDVVIASTVTALI